MFNWKEFDKTKVILAHSAKSRYKDELGQHHLYLRPNNFLSWIEFLKEDLGFFSLVDIAGCDSENGKLEVIYHLLNMGSHQRLSVHLELNEGDSTPTVTTFFLNADWMEREQSEMLNIKFDITRDPLILPNGQENYPLRKDTSFYEWPNEKKIKLPTLKYNPNKTEEPYPEENYQWRYFDLQSPHYLGLFETVTCFDPDKIIDLKMNIGFHYHGLEKLLENKDVIQILFLVDKVNLRCSPTYATLWAKTLEEVFRIKIPERAQAIRIVLLELARIADHLTVLYSICFEAGLSEANLILDLREKIYELFEKCSGHRQGHGLITLGGIKEDLPYGWIVECQSSSEIILKNLHIINNYLISQIRFRSFLEGESVSAQSIIQWGVSGPAMRAAGLNFDLRKSHPFYFYQEIDFDIPVGINGTAFDRYLIRYEEIFQSFRIITQVLDNLPLGEFLPEIFKGNYFQVLQTLQNLEKNSTWHYSSLESPSGESGFLVKILGSIKPHRIKLKTPGFFLAQALPVFVKGLREEQLAANVASLGISRWELDR